MSGAAAAAARFLWPAGRAGDLKVEAWLFGIAALACALMALGPADAGWMRLCAPLADLPALARAGLWQVAAGPGGPGGLALGAAVGAAVMAPLLRTPLRVVLYRSFPSRRLRSAVLLVGACALAWTAAMAALGLAGRVLALSGIDRRALLVLAAAAAALWQASPAKPRLASLGHRVPALAPAGLRADADCLRYGLGYGMVCAAGCGPLMLPMEFAPAPWLACLAAVAVALVERHHRAPPFAALALAVLAPALLQAFL